MRSAVRSLIALTTLLSVCVAVGCLLPDTSRLYSAETAGDGGVTPVEAGGDSAGDATSDAPTDAALDPSLIGWWSFEETSGTTVPDRSGHAHDGTLLGTPKHVAGRIGNGIEFIADGQAMTVTSLDGTNFPQNEGTLAFWLNVNPLQSGDRGIFDSYETFRPHVFVRTYTDELEATEQSAGQPATASLLFPLTRGSYQRVILVWFGGRFRLYVGAQTDEYLYGESWAPTKQVFRFCDACRAAVDEVRLYDRALGATEIDAIP